MGQNKVKNAHIIPQTYLRQFVAAPLYNPREESVFIALKNNFNTWVRTGIKNKPFSEKYFYDLSTSDDTQIIEDFLSQYIENDYQHIINKLNKEEMLYDEDLTNLFIFIICMYYRTQKMQNCLQAPINLLREMFLDFGVEEDSVCFQDYFSNAKDFSKLWLLGANEILKQSNFSKKSIFIIRNNTNLPFISSDNPVCKEFIGRHEIEDCFYLPFNKSVLGKTESFFFPMTPKILLIYCDGIDFSMLKTRALQVNDDNIVFRLNYFQLRNCEKYIISNRDNSNIDYARLYTDTTK